MSLKTSNTDTGSKNPITVADDFPFPASILTPLSVT